MSILKERIFRQMLLLCLLVFLFSAKGHIMSADTVASLETTQAIIDHGRLDIPFEEGHTTLSRDGKNYSKYGFGLPMYYIPLVAASDALSRWTHLPEADLAGFVISFASIPFAMLTLILFGKLLRVLEVSELYVWLLPLALGLGTLIWAYAGSDDSEEMQMAFLLLAIYGAVRRTPKAIVYGGIGFACLFLVKVVYVVFFPLLALYLITRPEEWRHRIRNTVVFTVPLIFAGCFDAWLNAIRFGNPLESGYGGEAKMFMFSQLPLTIPKLLVSPNKGLFIFCPILILGVLGWKQFASKYRPEAILFAIMILVNLFITGAWWSWGGGWSWGPRLLVPFIPLWLLPIAFWLEHRQSKLAFKVFAVLLFVSFIVQIPGIVVKDQEIHWIRYVELNAVEQRAIPSDYAMACILLRHKLVEQNEVYRGPEFNLPADRIVDLTRKRTFNGLNIWTEEVARLQNKPLLRWLPLLALFPICYLAIKIGKEARAPESIKAGYTP